ncbi:MAG: maleylpyruvate isomerase N-terminal domain-containing protein, partial [Microthrixaceae bacterium]|nr:maleylpyruvate isomerase N-terminal domain-containing protein [Microthrixaceae bacterium]
ALAGEPSRFLASFDPVASPAELVAASSATPEEVLASFQASNEALAAQLGALSDDDLQVQAEAPPGHESVAAVVHHALWDSWVHERDVLLPLGIEPEVVPGEVAACLRYAVALGPSLGVGRGEASVGTMGVRASDPMVALAVEVGDHVHVRDDAGDGERVLAGDAVELVESLSLRTPFAAE